MEDERISMLNIGMSVKDDFDANLKIIKGDTTMTEEDRVLLADYAAQAYESDYMKAMPVI